MGPHFLQTYRGNFVKKGEEKGYFKFGGSTVVLLFEKNKIRIDGDLLSNTLKGYETVIKEGERIGVSMINPTVSRQGFIGWFGTAETNTINCPRAGITRLALAGLQY